MKHIAIFLFLAALVVPAHGIQAQETSVEAVVEAETVTNADLEVTDPGLLPTSPFYFFKEIGRGLERALTFDQVKKTELELRITSEKAAEANTVAQQDPDNEQSIARALANFERAQERLRSRIERLGETSENPNIDAVLDRVAKRTIVHEKLLEEIGDAHEAQQNAISDIRSRMQEIFGNIAENDTPERFRKRLQDAFEAGRGSTLKHLRSVEILDRLQESDRIPDNVKDRLEELRNALSDKARDNIERFAEEGEDGANRLRDALGRVPGDALKRSVLLEEIRTRASDQAAGVLNEARDSLDEKIHDSADLAERVKKQVEEAENRLSRIKNKLRESDRETPQAIQRLVVQAEDHLEKAKTALREGNPRQAFGLARAADAIITNILRFIEKGVDAVGDAPQLLDRVQEILPPIRRNTDSNTDKPSVGLPCPLIDRASFARDCQVKGGEVVINQNHRCGPTPECKIPRNPDILNPDILNPDVTNPSIVPSPTSVAPAVQEFDVKSNDNQNSPFELRVKKGSRVRITFHVSETGVYYGGLDFRSDFFKSGTILPGKTGTVEFTADKSFDYTSYWPASGVLKSRGRITVE